MEALTNNPLGRYPVDEIWFSRGYIISISRHFTSEAAVFALSLGLPPEDLNIYYGVNVHASGFLSQPIFAPDVELEDYAIRKELIESWIKANLPKLSLWRKIRTYCNYKNWLMCGKKYA